ncbi:hypothetical protein [Hymenobacter psychrophilus]|uniref:Uncharacterized protein n=1 Tax=Hymenobacter psychrophilus TaxID=651662 RepID=A0A1H3MAG3_9BACT|nr:hypothetical protein [Hymenobacter psychrophilus]SDY73576.1 hypothetical protein SAMN04488069_112116 [Hymenobacter psychrophilus]
MQLSDEHRSTFLLTVNQLIEEYAVAYADDLLEGRVVDLSYPPNGGLNSAESEAIQQLRGKLVLHAAVRKVLAGCAADVVFDLLNLIDGTTEPMHGHWRGVQLVDTADSNAQNLLHDGFMEAYWDWRKYRGAADWHLDSLPE